MLLGCPSCHATLRVPAGAVREKGREVRCAKCKHGWHAYPTDLIPEISAETALKAADEIEKKLQQEEREKQRLEVEEMLAGMGMPVQDELPAPQTTQEPAAETITDDHGFDFDAIPVQDPEDEDTLASVTIVHAGEAAEPLDESMPHDPWNEQAQQEESVGSTGIEDTSEDEAETYHVTEEEMQQFSALVSQEELDAIEPSSALEALTGEKPDDYDVIEARLAEMEAQAPEKPTKKKAAKNVASSASKDTTLWLSLTLAACVLLCISTAFITQYYTLRTTLPFMDSAYNAIGYSSNQGLELVDMKITKNQLADKVSYDIEGAIQNNRTGYAAVPPVRTRLVDESGETMRTIDFAQDRKMEPNEKLSFSAPKLKPLTGTDGTLHSIDVDIGNSLEMMQR